MWRLSIVDDESNRTVVNLVRKQYSIGRAEENAIRLTERNISRQHALLERGEVLWTLQDLGSYTGCFVNDQRVEGQRALAHGDRLRIGDYTAVLTDGERDRDEADDGRNAATVPVLPTSTEDTEREDRLVVVEGTGVGTLYPLRESTTLVGRGEECDIALNDTSVSRQHCVIERDEHGRFQVLDKNSSNGVRVNGMDVRRITLYSGDVIELGDIQLQFVPRGTRFDPSIIGTRRTTPSAGRKFAKLAPMVLALGVLTSIAVVVVMRRPSNIPTASRSAEAGEVAMQLLKQAGDLYATRNLEAAHEVLERVPKGSTLRNSQEYRKIESAWADEQFELAERTTDLEVQRALLDRVARTQSVDSLRRKQAADQLLRLDQLRLNPSDLAQAPDATADGGDPPVEPSAVAALAPVPKPLIARAPTFPVRAAAAPVLAKASAPTRPVEALPVWTVAMPASPLMPSVAALAAGPTAHAPSAPPPPVVPATAQATPAAAGSPAAP